MGREWGGEEKVKGSGGQGPKSEEMWDVGGDSCGPYTLPPRISKHLVFIIVRLWGISFRISSE